jgi:hypothetical protein
LVGVFGAVKKARCSPSASGGSVPGILPPFPGLKKIV